jgi:hypothetical protein
MMSPSGRRTIAKRAGSGSNPVPNGVPEPQPRADHRRLRMSLRYRSFSSRSSHRSPQHLARTGGGLVSYAGMKLAAGRAREAHWLVYAIAGLFAWGYLLLN